MHNPNILKLTHHCPAYLQIFHDGDKSDTYNWKQLFPRNNSDLPMMIKKETGMMLCNLKRNESINSIACDLETIFVH